MRLIFTRLSSSTSISPLSICLVWPDSCSLSVRKLHHCLSQGDRTLTLLVPELTEATFVSQQSLDPSCRFHTPNKSVDIVQPRLPTFICLLTIVNNQFRHVSHGELTLNLPSINTRDEFGVAWDLFWRLDLNI